jgi:hypothetical protein
MAPRTQANTLDYDVHIQTQFCKATQVRFPGEVIRRSALIDWNDFEASCGANQEWLWTGLMPATTFFANFLEVEVHPGWCSRVSTMKALVQNPGSNKDAAVDILTSATRRLQNDRKRLFLLDEFTMPFLYQAMKANDNRMLGLYTELDSLLQKCTQTVPGSVVDAKTRMIRIYDTRHWGYGVKGEATYTFENMEELPRTLFPIFGAVQPEVYYHHMWQDPLSGFWQRWGVISTPPKEFEWQADRSSIKPTTEMVQDLSTMLENVDKAAADAGNTRRFTLRDDTYVAFGELRNRMAAIKQSNAKDPVVLSSVSKVLREVVSHMGIIHAMDQAADNETVWRTEIPCDVYERAAMQVGYHTNVALCARPPAVTGTRTIAVLVDDTVDSVRLRTQVMKMRGLDVGGTDLKRAGVFGDQTAEQWRNQDGRLLQEFGLLRINMRSYGFSVSRTPVPDESTDPTGYANFVKVLKEKLRMNVEQYRGTLERSRRQHQAEGAAEDEATPAPRTPGVNMKTETKEEPKDSDSDLEFVDHLGSAAPAASSSAAPRTSSGSGAASSSAASAASSAVATARRTPPGSPAVGGKKRKV